MSLAKKLAVGTVALGSLLCADRVQGLEDDGSYGPVPCLSSYTSRPSTIAGFNRDYLTLESFVEDAIPTVVFGGLCFMGGMWYGGYVKRRAREKREMVSFLLEH